MTVREEIEAHLLAQGVCSVRDDPRWGRRLAELTAEGALVRLLPGVYALASLAHDVRIRCAALMVWDGDAVVTGSAASAVAREVPGEVTLVEFHSTRKKQAPPGYRLHRSRVPEDQVVEHRGLRIVRAAWAAVHQASTDGGAAIDDFLRRSFGSVGQVVQAFARFGRRWGNPVRRTLVRESRSNPWSPAERQLHRGLHTARIPGWRANLRVKVGPSTYFLDAAFEAEMLALEVEGRDPHTLREAHEHDCRRMSDLTAQGWTFLRLTWSMVHDQQLLERLVRDTLRGLRRRSRSSRRVAAAG